MSVQKFLDKIKNGRYGADITDAIIGGIKKCYDDASVNHDNANMEVKMARGTHNTLNDRLDKSEQKLDETNAQLSDIILDLHDWVSVKKFRTIQDAYDYAHANNKSTVFFPAGEYIVDTTINVYDTVSTVGSGINDTIIICNHDGIVFDASVNLHETREQTGNFLFEKMTIKRESIPATKISGNHAIKLHATYNQTILSELSVVAMGDSPFYMENVSTKGTGPIHFRNIRTANNYNYSLNLKGSFADVFIDGYHVYSDGGGLNFDASNKIASSPAQQIVIKNCDLEHCGTLHNNNEFPLPAIKCDSVSGVSIADSTIQTATNAGGTETHTIHLENCKYPSIRSSEITNRMGGNAYGIASKNCTNLTIDAVDISCANTGNGVLLDNPARHRLFNIMFSSVGDHELKVINTRANRGNFIINDANFGFINEDYEGSYLTLSTVVANYIATNKHQTHSGELTCQKGSPRYHFKDTSTTERRLATLENSNNTFKLLIKDDNGVIEWSPLTIDLSNKKLGVHFGSGTVKELLFSNNCTTVARPTTPNTGYMIFDSTIRKPIWWDGTNWVDAMGTVV